MSLIHPFKKIQSEKNLTMHGMARLMGVSIATLQQVYGGVIKSPSTMLKSLQSLGYDLAAMSQEYDAWRQALLSEAREQALQ